MVSRSDQAGAGLWLRSRRRWGEVQANEGCYQTPVRAKLSMSAFTPFDFVEGRRGPEAFSTAQELGAAGHPSIRGRQLPFLVISMTDQQTRGSMADMPKPDSPPLPPAAVPSPEPVLAL